MPDSKPAKARLIEVLDLKTNKTGKTVTVQFNPESLKVTYANQIVPPKGEGNVQENATLQYVGAGTTKLTLTIWFDVTGQAPDAGAQETDVRKLTEKVANFMKTQQGEKPGEFTTPLVRFEWGTFRFDGVMDSLEESLEFFSSEGVPLRASMALSLSRQRIEFLWSDAKPQGTPPPGAGGPGGAAPGTQPLTQAQAGQSLQGLAANLGTGADWRAIAVANNIENPRLLAPGQLIDLNARVSVSMS